MPPRPLRLGLLVNPTAGKGRGRLVGEALLQAMDALAAPPSGALQLVHLSRPDRPSALAAARGAVVSGDVDALAVVGGDGMVSLGLQSVIDTAVPLLVVAAGTGNDFARQLRLPLPGDGLAQVVTAAVATLAPLAAGDRPFVQPVDLAVATLANGRRVPLGCVVSIGFDAVVNAAANRLRWPRGPRRYELAVLRELPRFRSPRLVLEVRGPEGDLELERRVTLVAVANTPTYGGGLRIAPQARTDDGLLDLVVVRAMARCTVLRLFPAVRRGAHVAHPAVEMRRVRSIVVREVTPAGPAFADGEELGALPLRVDAAPGAVRVLLPPAHPTCGAPSGG